MTLFLDKGKKQILEILYAKKRNERSSYMTKQLQNREGVLTTIHDIQKQSKKYILPKILK